VADIAVGYALVLARELGIEEVFTPNIARYWDRISARPAFQRAMVT
jgi:glutathione S-transferase